MKELIRNCKIAIIVLLVLSVALGTGLVYQQKQSQSSLLAVAGENRASLRERYAQAGSIFTQNGIPLAYSEDGMRHYAEDELLQLSTMHLVGDYTHHISNTIETQYQGEILGNARGITEQLLLDVSGRGIQGSDVHLTVNSELNRYMYEQIRNYKGAAILMNYETGAILGITSTPTTSMSNVIDYVDIPDTSLFNRALQSQYAPASTFKILTSAAWVQSANFDPNFTVESKGAPHYPNGARDKEHAPYVLDLNEGFAQSSNVFFGDLAVKMGYSYFKEYLDNLNLDAIRSLDRLYVAPMIMRGDAALEDQSLLSWFGTGQPVGSLELKTTPLHLAIISSAIANGGAYPTPYIVDRVENPLGKVSENKRDSSKTNLFSPEVAIRLEQLMVYGVEAETSAQFHARIPGVEVAGKSGTLEVDSLAGYTKNGLWTGYLTDPDYPYAVAVITENIETANASAVTIGRMILEQAMASGVK